LLRDHTAHIVSGVEEREKVVEVGVLDEEVRIDVFETHVTLTAN
jgi:hypothetical protein